MSKSRKVEKVRIRHWAVQPRFCSGPFQRHRIVGFTLVELLVAVAVIGTIASIVVPGFLNRLHDAKMKRVIMDIRDLELSIKQFERFEGRWPTDLTELDSGPFVDRWGHLYEYLSSDSRDWNGKARRDRFLVPLNSDFDLYSTGPDGESRAPLPARPSWDDVIRANDGLFIGPATEF